MAVTPAIPASEIVAVTPSVVSAGGNGLDLNGLLLTDDVRAPIGEVLQFETAEDVADYFGSSSQMDALASIYFLGFDGSNVKPGRLLVAQYPIDAVAAYLRGGRISAMTLLTLQAISGTLSIAVDGITYSGSPNLVSATSFSNAASIIGDVLGLPDGASIATVTGSISGTTLTVTAVTSGSLAVGHLLEGAGTGVIPGTYITVLGTGTGGTGTYTVSDSQSAPSQLLTATQPGIVYDSVSGAFIITSPSTGSGSIVAFGSGVIAGTLKLTLVEGALVSAGAGAADADTFMDALVLITQNWATLFTSFEPDDQSKVDLANWENSKGNRYLYAMVDTAAVDVTSQGPSEPVQDILDAEYAGVAMIYEDPDIDTTGQQIAAFLAGAIASIDFTQTQGRTTMKFRKQSGLTPQVLNASEAGYLAGSSLNFYGSWTTADDQFTFFANGVVTGDFLWIDSYVNQIWLNAQLQLALMVLLTQARSIPYNRSGYALIEAACLDPILQAVDTGVIQAGVTLSEQQKALVNNSAGLKVDDVLTRRGWYLQVRDATPQVRIARGSPPCTLFYTDGQSIQSINLASIAVL